MAQLRWPLLRLLLSVAAADAVSASMAVAKAVAVAVTAVVSAAVAPQTPRFGLWPLMWPLL